MNLSGLKPPGRPGKKQQRVGRGMGSGRGKTPAAAHKGATSVSGYSQDARF